MDKIITNTFPLGFNDNIYHEGNISKMPDFDVFSLLEIRKRKSRSHGIRKKGNGKRKKRAVKRSNTSLLHAGGSGVRLNDGPDIKLFILVGLGRSFFVCCLAHRGSTVGFLLLQCSSGVVRHPRDLQVSVATRFCRVLIFASS